VIVFPIFTEKLHFVMMGYALLLSIISYLFLRRYNLLPFSKKHFLIIWAFIVVFIFLATFLTNNLLPTGLFRETNNFTNFVYISYGGFGLYVKSFLASFLTLSTFYWIRYS